MTDLQRIEAALVRIQALVEARTPRVDFQYREAKAVSLPWWQQDPQDEPEPDDV